MQAFGCGRGLMTKAGRQALGGSFERSYGSYRVCMQSRAPPDPGARVRVQRGERGHAARAPNCLCMCREVPGVSCGCCCSPCIVVCSRTNALFCVGLGVSCVSVARPRSAHRFDRARSTDRNDGRTRPPCRTVPGQNPKSRVDSCTWRIFLPTSNLCYSVLSGEYTDRITTVSDSFPGVRG